MKTSLLQMLLTGTIVSGSVGVLDQPNPFVLQSGSEENELAQKLHSLIDDWLLPSESLYATPARESQTIDPLGGLTLNFVLGDSQYSLSFSMEKPELSTKKSDGELPQLWCDQN